MGRIQFGCRFSVDLFVFEGLVNDLARHGIEHDFKQVRNGFQLIGHKLAY